MINIRGIDHINMYVKSVRETVDFYRKLFSFEVFEEELINGQPHAIIGAKDKVYLCLYEKPDLVITKNEISHLGFNTTNFEELEHVLKENNVTIKLKYEYPHSRSAYIQDPSGYELEISEAFGGRN